MLNSIKWKIENLEAITSGRKTGASFNDLQHQIKSLWELANKAFDLKELTPDGYSLFVNLKYLNDFVDGRTQFSLCSIQKIVEQCKALSENQIFK